MPHGGVCHARKTIEPAATSSAGGSDDLAPLAGVRSGMGASSRLPERSTISTERFGEGKHRKPNEHGSDFGFEERAEDIPGGGGDLCHNIPDLLRMAAGMDVTQINANTWAISVRGFNSQFSDKLLVLMDGRAVYTPLFGEVSWDTQDVPLEGIERIEVIRGPGGTIWGANAVNGVINIIMKKAEIPWGPRWWEAEERKRKGSARCSMEGKLKKTRAIESLQSTSTTIISRICTDKMDTTVGTCCTAVSEWTQICRTETP